MIYGVLNFRRNWASSSQWAFESFTGGARGLARRRILQ